MRLSYTLTPTLSLQLYGQPFSSSGHYENYKELVNGRADRYADRYAPFATSGNADFTVLSFRTTNVLRWEFKPGSTMFVVWQQGREGFRPNSALPLRQRLRRHLRHAVVEYLPGEALVLAQSVVAPFPIAPVPGELRPRTRASRPGGVRARLSRNCHID